MKLWYRHALELRLPALFASAWAVLSAIKFNDVIAAGLLSLEIGKVPATVSRFGALLTTLGPERTLVCGAHAGYSLFLAVLLPFAFAGVGLNDPSFSSSPFGQPPHPSRAVFFTLSLPVSRRRLVATRLASAAIAICLIFGVYLAAHVAVLASRGTTIPFWPMAAISFAAALLAIAATAFDSLILLCHPVVYPAVLVPLILTATLGSRIAGGVAVSGFSLGAIATTAVVAALFVTLATWWAREIEF